MRRFAVACIALAACTKFDTVQPGTCGNGLLEDGEDCDNPKDSRCVACSLTCTSDADCLEMPPPRNGAAYHCGYDQPKRLCHAPSGSFAGLAGQQAYDVLGFGVVDINGDGIGDAIGLSETQLVARFGDASGQLAAINEAVMPSLGGAPAIHDVNGDGAIDLTLPTQDGLVAFTGVHGTLVPYTFATSFGTAPNGTEGLRALRLDNRYDAVLFEQSGGLTVGVVDVLRGGATMGVPITTPLCGGAIDPAQFDPSGVAVYDVSSVYGMPAILFALTSPRLGGGYELCAMTVVETVAGTFTMTEVTPSGAMVGKGSPVLAQLDPSALGCPSLVLPTLPTVTRYAAVKTTTCGFATTATPLPFATSPNLLVPVGRVPLQPPIASRASDALVFVGGIAAYDAGTNQLYGLYVSDIPLGLSAFGDVDGDNKTDAIVAAPARSGVDVLYRVTTPSDGFLRLRIATDNPIKLLQAGDYDGNGLADVLAVERVTTPVPNNDHDAITIAYGTPDRVLPPIEVGDFTKLVSITPAQLLDSVDQTGTIDDLGVLDERQPGETVLALLHGTPQRGLMPYFDPRPGPPPPWMTSSFGGVVVGSFLTGDPAGSVDLIAIDGGSNGAQIWRLGGAGPGALAAPFVAQPIDAGICREGSTLSGTFCVDSTVFTPWPSGDRQLVIGIDGVRGNAIVIDPTLITSSTTQSFPLAPQPVIPPGVGQLQVPIIADTDGDGVDELIIAYGPNQTDHGGIRSCTVTGTTLDCSRDLLALANLQGTCTAVATGAVTLQGQSADSGPATSLVVDCGQTFYRIDYVAGAYQASQLLGVDFQPRQFALADVTGDLVPDLVMTSNENGVTMLFVYPQCTSRGCP